jgi:hypothetical protein
VRWLRASEAAVQLTRASLELRLRPASHTVALLGEHQTDARRDDVVSVAKLR